MKKLLVLSVLFVNLQYAFSQNSPEEIDMVADNWKVPEGANFEKFDNRNTLVLSSGRATVNNLNFTNGSIEVDVYANKKRSFAGITFRKQNNTMEEVYMRMHKSSQVDAVQYTPIFNNESNWQLYREYQAQVTFENAGWNTLRIEVKNSSADVFVNGSLVLTLDQLRTDNLSGEIGLFALFTNRFSNFQVSHKDLDKAAKKDDEKPLDPSIITSWEVTQAKPYQDGEIRVEDFSKEAYTTFRTEASGLLPISKYINKTSSGNFEQNSEDYIIALTTIQTTGNETRTLSFDYSDKIMIYLNGVLIFQGNNAFRAKGVQYMGHVDINTNKLYLNLDNGVNEIHCVVVDKANGWGLMAKIE